MEICQFDYPNTPKINEDITLCLGFFDGVHLGHQKLVQAAKKEGYKVAVLTFDNPPASVTGKVLEYLSLSSISDKAEYLEELGVDYFLLMHFDKEIMKLTKDEFIDDVIKILNPKKIYCGSDYRFGIRAEGNPDYLSLYFDVNKFSLEKSNVKKISSRDIVKEILNGNMPDAKTLLGRNYRINGLVVEGNHKGKTINFPTANLSLDYPYVVPHIGVYIGFAYVYDVKYRAIIEVGTHPTILPLVKPIVEVHIIDFDGNIYGKDIFVEFVRFIRDEKKFASLDNLKNQLEKDKKLAKKSLRL